MLNCFDATGYISLHPPQKNYINRTVPFFPIVSSMRLLCIIPLPPSRGPCVIRAKEGPPPQGVSLLYLDYLYQYLITLINFNKSNIWSIQFYNIR